VSFLLWIWPHGLAIGSRNNCHFSLNSKFTPRNSLLVARILLNPNHEIPDHPVGGYDPNAVALRKSPHPSAKCSGSPVITEAAWFQVSAATVRLVEYASDLVLTDGNPTLFLTHEANSFEMRTETTLGIRAFHKPAGQQSPHRIRVSILRAVACCPIGFPLDLSV
jgi:hypothetical protein